MTPFKHHAHRWVKAMSVTEEILLDMINISTHKYRVVELIKVAEGYQVASHATLHSAIMKLKRIDFIELEVDRKDARVRNVKITRAGKNYLKGYQK